MKPLLYYYVLTIRCLISYNPQKEAHEILYSGGTTQIIYEEFRLKNNDSQKLSTWNLANNSRTWEVVGNCLLYFLASNSIQNPIKKSQYRTTRCSILTDDIINRVFCFSYRQIHTYAYVIENLKPLNKLFCIEQIIYPTNNDLKLPYMRYKICGRSLKRFLKWIQTFTSYKQNIAPIASGKEYMNRQMINEGTLILYYLIAQYKRISKNDIFNTQPCIVETLNNSW